jgi:hypothetical protein
VVIRVKPESLRAASVELGKQATAVGGMCNDLSALGWLADPGAQEGLLGLVTAFGAVFEVVVQDLDFMAGQVKTAADAYETLDGDVLPQYRKQVAERQHDRLTQPPRIG